MSGILKRFFPRLPLRKAAAPVGSRPHPLDLSDSQLDSLQALVRSPHWATWATVVERLWVREAEILTHPGLSYEDWLHQQALVQAIRAVATAPDNILSYERQADARADDRARSERDRDPLYAVRNSPYLSLAYAGAVEGGTERAPVGPGEVR